jgi:hypothetical protein
MASRVQIEVTEKSGEVIFQYKDAHTPQDLAARASARDQALGAGAI